MQIHSLTVGAFRQTSTSSGSGHVTNHISYWLASAMEKRLEYLSLGGGRKKKKKMQHVNVHVGLNRRINHSTKMFLAPNIHPGMNTY